TSTARIRPDQSATPPELPPEPGLELDCELTQFPIFLKNSSTVFMAPSISSPTAFKNLLIGLVGAAFSSAGVFRSRGSRQTYSGSLMVPSMLRFSDAGDTTDAGGVSAGGVADASVAASVAAGNSMRANSAAEATLPADGCSLTRKSSPVSMDSA